MARVSVGRTSEHTGKAAGLCGFDRACAVRASVERAWAARAWAERARAERTWAERAWAERAWAAASAHGQWCRRGWVSIQCKCNIFQYPRLPTPAAGAPWTGAANRLEHYNDARAVVVLLKTRVKSKQTLPRKRVWKSRSWWEYDASPTTQPQIMDTKGAIARRMRSSRKRCVYPMSQHHNRAQRSPCGRLHLACSLRSAGELRLLGRRSSSTCFGERP